MSLNKHIVAGRAPISERVKEFLSCIERYDGPDDLATSASLNPFSDEDLAAYSTAYKIWLFGDEDWTQTQKDSPDYEHLKGVFWMTKLIIEDFVGKWVLGKFGKEAAHEIGSLLEDLYTMEAFADEKRAEEESRPKNRESSFPRLL